MRRARSTKAPSTEPITIPAIWPPVRPALVIPFCDAAPVAVGLLAAVGVLLEDDVELGNKGAMDVVMGR